MSFKCRSASSLSSHTLVHPSEDSLYDLYPTRPEKAYGLGIYAPQASSVASFLAPRPSLKKIRGQTRLPRPPMAASPLPPLPVYDPEKYAKSSAALREALQPVWRKETLIRERSRRMEKSTTKELERPAVGRIVSSESGSSVYSRSVTGETNDRAQAGAGQMEGIGRIGSSETARRNLMCPNAASLKFRSPAGDATTNTALSYDNAAAPGLLTETIVSDCGHMRGWATSRDHAGNQEANSEQRSLAWAGWCNLPPLQVPKTRGIGTGRRNGKS